MDTTPIRVLLIEDNPGDARLIREMLAEAPGAPFALECVEQLATGLARLAAGGIAVVLLDLSLPDAQGLDTFARAHAHAPHAPIIVLTGLDDEAVALKAVREGAQDYLVKGQVDSRLLARSIHYAIERQRAEEVNAQRNRQLAALYAIDRAAAQTLNMNEVLNDALDKVLEVLEVEAGGILLLEPDGETLRLRVHRGLSDEFVWSVDAVKIGDGLAGRAAVERKPVTMDIADYPLERLAPFIVKEGFQSMASTPLVAHDRVLGALNLATRRRRVFPGEQIHFLASIGQQLGGAVENARLYEAARQRASEFAALYETTRDLAAQHDLPVLLQTITERATTLLGAPSGGIYLYDAARGDLELVVVQGFALRLGTRLQPGEGMAGRVAQTRQPLIIDDYRTWEGRSPKYAGIPFTAVLEVPMLYGGELIGVLVVYEIDAHPESAGQATTTRKYTEADVRLLSLLAAQAAGAVHNARLYQQVRASEQEYRTLVENSTEVIWTLDTEGNFTFFNRQGEQVSGYKVKDWLGKSFAPLIAPEDLPRIQQVFLETLAGKPQNYDVRVCRADGSLFYLSVNTAPLYRDGQVVGTISFGRDVTAQREAEAALQQRLAELSALFEVSSALRGVEGVEHMLPLIVDKAIEVCRADCGSVLLLDKSGEVLVCRYGTGARQALVGARLRLDQGISGRVAQSGVPHVSPDFQHDPLLAFAPTTSARLPEIASDICVPLRIGDQIVGAMHISTYTPRTFAEAEARLLTAIADMAASAIHRVSLFEQLEHRVHELSTLFDVGKMVTASLRVEDVLEFIVGAASRAVQAEAAYLFLWDEREERLVMRAAKGFSPTMVGQDKYRLGEGLSGWVFLEGQPVNVTDLAADPRWKREPEQEAALSAGRANNALVVPLILGEKTLGVLGVVNKIDAPAFTASDESLLTALASEVAISIENAHLYEDVRGVSIATIRSLATAIDARDPYTRGHSEEVTRLAVQVARELGWSGADLEMLEFAALLHDAGKIAVPDAILKKVEPLTPDDWNIIRMHPYHSAQIIKPVEPLQRIVPWVYHHQEKWDGSGYPDGLTGEAIPLAARIIAVADAFNAMTTDRTYRKERTSTEALAEIKRCAGTQFDPRVVEAFLQVSERGFDITGGGKEAWASWIAR